MNIVIVEDEYLVAKRLRRFIEDILDKHTQIKCFETIEDASEHLETFAIDILFLDLNLHGNNGFDLLKSHASRAFYTIVVSANSERAIEAFDIGVLDFVSKPFKRGRIKKAIERVTEQRANGQTKYLCYRHLGSLQLLPVTDILYIKAVGHYSDVFTHSGRSVLHDKNLDKLTILLPPNFHRIHRSFIVPFESIKSISSSEGSKYWAELVNGDKLPIGRTRIKSLREHFIS